MLFWMPEMKIWGGGGTSYKRETGVKTEGEESVPID